MTERMENTIRHIKSGVDVDPWAADEVERVFKAVDEIRVEIEQFAKQPNFGDLSTGASCGAMKALEIIEKHINGKEK